MKKLQRSIRLTPPAQKILNRKIARITLNPALFALSLKFIDWTGRERGTGKISASELLLNAKDHYPNLHLSWAVEGYIAILLSGESSLLKPLTARPYEKLPIAVHRFMALSSSEKIRRGEQ